LLNNYFCTFSGDCDGITSVFRVQADSCGRLWVLDSGQIYVTVKPKQICLPKILIFDLQTDKLLTKYVLPAEFVKEDGLFSNIVVDVRDDCENVHAYLTDVWRFNLVVFSLEKMRAWLISDHLFYPDPLAAAYKCVKSVASHFATPAISAPLRDICEHSSGSADEHRSKVPLLQSDSDSSDGEIVPATKKKQQVISWTFDTKYDNSNEAEVALKEEDESFVYLFIFQLHHLDFYWTDGVFGMALSPYNKHHPDRILYFHPMSSFREFYVRTSVICNETGWMETKHAFKALGQSRGPSGHVSSSWMDRNGIMFFNLVTRDSVGCWDTRKPYKRANLGVVAKNSKTLVFPNDIKIDQEPRQSVWLISNWLPYYLYEGLDEDKVNFRILRAYTDEAIKNTICDPHISIYNTYIPYSDEGDCF
ncbi:hypothetical protein NQ318_021812, partial [Aromia moschata]